MTDDRKWKKKKKKCVCLNFNASVVKTKIVISSFCTAWDCNDSSSSVKLKLESSNITDTLKDPPFLNHLLPKR